MQKSRWLAAGLLCVSSLAASIARATDYNEAVSGDLSGDRLNPTAILPTNGSNRVTATSAGGDLEYFRVTIPSGQRLSAVVNVSHSGTQGLSFIGAQSGAAFTEPPSGTVVGNLLGYAHFGPGSRPPGTSTVGTDILDNIATGPGSMTFTPPLATGTYTFWAQELGGSVTYTLDFQLTATGGSAPLPGPALALLGAALAIAGVWQVRRRRA